MHVRLVDIVEMLPAVKVHWDLSDIEDLKIFDVAEEFDSKWRQWEAVSTTEPQANLDKLYCNLDLGDTQLVHLLKVHGAQPQVGTKHAHVCRFMLTILAQQDSVRQSPGFEVLSMLAVVLSPLLLHTVLVLCPYMRFC